MSTHIVAEMDMAAFVDIGIRWRVIPLGMSGKIPEDQMVRALHIECAKEDAPVVKAVLSDVYSANAKMFPGNIKLRFVPDIYMTLSPQLRAKILHLRARQDRFLKNVKEMTSYEITSLDRPFMDQEGYKASIRERLMEMRSQDREYLSQFVNVAPQYNSAGVTFTFIPELEAEARSRVASMIPYFRHEYGEGIKKFFSADAWDLHRESYWDPEVNAAVTPDDKLVQDIMETDPEYHWEDLRGGNGGDKNEAEKKEMKRPDPKEKSLYGDDGGDSVSTLWSLKGGLRMPRCDWQRFGDAKEQTVIASTSSVTPSVDGTVESRVSLLEVGQQQMNNMLQTILQLALKTK